MPPNPRAAAPEPAEDEAQAGGTRQPEQARGRPPCATVGSCRGKPLHQLGASLISWQVSWQMSHLLYHFYHSIFPFSIHSRSWSPLPTALPVPVNLFLNSVKRPAVTCSKPVQNTTGYCLDQWGRVVSDTCWLVGHSAIGGKSVHEAERDAGRLCSETHHSGALSTAHSGSMPGSTAQVHSLSPSTPHWGSTLEPLVTGPGKGSVEEEWEGPTHPGLWLQSWATAPGPQL